MRRVKYISGAVLPTVMVVSVLLLLTVLTIASLWESDFLFFSRHRYDSMQRAHLESGFTLSSEYPETVMERLDADSTLLLYDSVANSRIKISRKPWGLYEVVSVSGQDAKIHSSKIMGKRAACGEEFVFCYKNNRSALTLTGETRFRGHIRIPRNGVVYGQMGSTFFNGEKIASAMMKESGEELLKPEQAALDLINELWELRDGAFEYLPADSTGNGFHGNDPLVFAAGNRLESCRLSGNIIVAGDDIDIAAGAGLSDIIVVGRNVRVEEGFSGTLQIFAADSVDIGNNVILDYPSGVFSAKYIGIGDGSEINGYAIVNAGDKPDVRNANYRQSRLSVVRGLVYVSGTAQFQGIVSGAVLLDKAVYYSPRGYYENMICDATVLSNDRMAWPLWLPGPAVRKEVKWVY